VIYRGIVVVHGVGRQQRGDQLDSVVEPLIEFLGSQAIGHRNARVVARNPRSGDDGASSVIHLAKPDTGEVVEQWDVREAWWAQVFQPSSAQTVLSWAIIAFFAHVSSTIQNVLLRNAARLIGRNPPVHGSGVWEVPVAGSYIFYLLDFFGWLVITAGYLAVYSVGFLLALLLYIFLLLPGLQLIPAAGALQRSIVDVFTGGIGAQQAVTNRHIALAEAASLITRALQPFLDPDAVSPGEARPYSTVTVIAHSGGCPVAFEALAGEAVKRWCAPEHGQRRWVTLIMLGSGLNLAWRMRARRKDRDRSFWERPITDHVNWINLYARYDPVSQGEPPADMVQTLTRAKLEDQPWLGVRVANDDWPFTDHFSYWTNDEEVNARLVHAIVDSRLGRAPIANIRGSYDAADADPLRLEDAVYRAVQRRAAGHRRSVTLRSSLRLLLLILLAAVLIRLRGLIERVGASILSASGWTWPQDGPLGWIARVPWPRFLDWLRSPDFQHWAVGAIATIYAAIILLLLAGLVAALVSWLRSDRDDPWPPPPRKEET
jgi:hypothetical protein